MKNKKTLLILGIPAVLCLIAVIVLLVSAAAPDRLVMTGIIETPSTDLASKIPGRVVDFRIDEGDRVAKGQVLAVIESKEMDAKVAQARALVQAAHAKYTMALNGARPEERQAAERMYRTAAAQFELAEKTWKRVEKVFRDSVISRQERDQAEFQYTAAREQMEAARARYEMALKGARDEEIAGAKALYEQAQNGLNEALAYQEELRVTSPLDGEVSKRVVDKGEIVASGFPIITLINPEDSYVVLQLREDQLQGMTIGRMVQGRMPAFGGTVMEFRVTSIAAMGEFATWKPTNQKGDFDLKTFEVHLKPVKAQSALRPGMTVHITL